MLNLSDPLWAKLDDAHRDRDIPKLIARLSETWDDDEANSLFWDCLCHQETCYGATYAAIPHFLDIAQSATDPQPRLEIAVFVGFVGLCAFDPQTDDCSEAEGKSLNGLPETLDAWDQKLQPFRSLVAMYEDPARASTDYQRNEQLPRYRHVLAVGGVNEADLERMRAIRFDFFQALPRIRDLCEKAFNENLHDEDAPRYLLGSVAAADGLLSLGRLLHYGFEGMFRCSSCERLHEYMLFGDRLAIYASDDALEESAFQPMDERNRLLSDYKDGAPTRSDGFVSPIVQAHEVTDERITALLGLAERALDPKLPLLLRHLLGSFSCTRCGARAGLKGL